MKPTGRPGRYAFEDVLEVTVRIVTAELRGLDQAHMIVIDGQLAVVDMEFAAGARAMQPYINSIFLTVS